MSALSLFAGSARSVRVISISHDTLLFLEPPGVAHPATIAAPEAVSLTEEVLVEIIVSQGTVNKVLFGKALRCFAFFLGNVAFECRVGSESPAGTTATLLLDWVHVTILDEINMSGISYEGTTATTAATAAFIVTNSLVAS